MRRLQRLGRDGPEADILKASVVASVSPFPISAYSAKIRRRVTGINRRKTCLLDEVLEPSRDAQFAA